uniref:PHD-type domain-containing protein n=1 Tax=Lygus hesperus TaxID=30085 RepID=A0A0K8SYY3_LYGHE
MRPVSRNTIPISSLKENDMVMVNHNLECPDERGYWYDLKIERVVNDMNRTTFVQGTLFAGVDRTPMQDMKVIFPDEIMEICESKMIIDKTREELDLMQTEPTFKRKTAPLCDKCKDNPRRKCKECSCVKCGGKEEPDKQIVCDECECASHIWCLDPPLEELPQSDEWYCPDCRNNGEEVVKAGEKLKESSKKAKMASSKPQV